MHGNTSSAFALRALCVRRMQRMRGGNGFQLELLNWCVDHREALLCEHQAVGKTQPGDIALCATGPWAQVPDSGGKGVEGLRPFRAE